MTRSIVLMAAARAISLVFGILLLGVLGRRLGPSGFGTLQFALAIMVYPTLVVDLGLTTFGLRELAKGSPSGGIIREVLGARSVLALGVVFVVLGTVVVLPLEAETRTILVVLAIALPVSAMNVRWVLQGEQRFDRAAVIEILSTGTQLVAAVFLVQNPGDVVPAAAALTLATCVTTVSSIVLAGRWRRFRPEIGREVRRTIARSLPLGAAAISIAIYYSIDTVLVGIFRGEQEVAFYTAAYRLILPILALAGVVASVAIPHLSFLSVSDETAANHAAVDLSRRLVVVALPIAVGGALVAEPIIATVYGSSFLPAADPFRILIWSVVTVYANAAFAFLLLARQRDLRYLWAVTAGAAVNVGLNLLVIPVAGMIGAAVTTMASEILVLGLILWWTRDVSLRAVLGATRAAAPPTIVMAVAIWPVKGSLVAVPLGLVVYGLVAIATGAIPVKHLFDRRIPRES